MNDVDQLKQRLTEIWSDIQQTVVDEAIDEWRRLRACVVQSNVILNMCCNINCGMSSVDIFTLNGWLNMSRLLLFLVTVDATQFIIIITILRQ